MSKKVLVIEDDPEVVALLTEPLAEMGFSCESSGNGREGLDLALTGGYELILLDLMLPEMEGSDVCRAIREQKKHLPIIVLSARSDELSTALLLELGADDYIAKPFRRLELKARIKAVLRRVDNSNDKNSSELRFGSLTINPNLRTVSLEEKELDLTAREFDLLVLLAANAGRPFTRDELNETLFGYEPGVYDHSISCHINRIRGKLEQDPRKPQFLLTKRGVGYYFNKGN